MNRRISADINYLMEGSAPTAEQLESFQPNPMSPAQVTNPGAYIQNQNIQDYARSNYANMGQPTLERYQNFIRNNNQEKDLDPQMRAIMNMRPGMSPGVF